MALLLALLVALLPLDAAAREEILSFDAVVEVLSDGTLEVTETIRIRAEGDAVVHGIWRDVPLHRRDPAGQAVATTFSVVAVDRNGAPESHMLATADGIARLRIGKPNVTLPAPSVQTYRIVYRSDGQLDIGVDRDSLTWRVLGTEWAFPVLSARVEFRLPAGVPILEAEGHATAAMGRRGAEATRADRAGGVVLRLSGPLRPGRDFVARIAWPAAAVAFAPPAAAAAASGGGATARPFRPPTLAMAAILASLAGLGGLFLAWLAVGRDGPRAPVYPRFEPPKGVSPAAARYILRQGFDGPCLTAAILSMAVKGAVRISLDENGTQWGVPVHTLTPLGADDRGLSPGEQAAYAALFVHERPIDLSPDETTAKFVAHARDMLHEALREEHCGATFRANRGALFAAIGFAVAAGVLLIGVLADGGAFLVAVWGAAAVLAWWLGHTLRGWAAAWPGWLAIGLFALRIGIPVGFVALILADPILISPTLRQVHVPTALAVIGSGIGLGLGVLLFDGIIAAPTRAGKRLRAAVEGFRIYMRTAEQRQINARTPPDRTPERFERLLPYAVALGLPQHWSAQFDDVLATAPLSSLGWLDMVGGFDSIDVARALDEGGPLLGSFSTMNLAFGTLGSGGIGVGGGGGGFGGGGGW